MRLQIIDSVLVCTFIPIPINLPTQDQFNIQFVPEQNPTWVINIH